MSDEALRLLVVIDESELGVHAAALGTAVARRLGAEAVFHIAIGLELVEARSPAGLEKAVGGYHDSCRERAAQWFERAQQRVADSGVSVTTVLTIDEEPCAAVQRVAREQRCALIVVGSQGRGTVGRVLHGSLVADLVRESPVPVLVCREDMAVEMHAVDAPAPTA